MHGYLKAVGTFESTNLLVAHGRFAVLCKTDSILTDIEFLMECIILATCLYRIQLCKLKEKLAYFANRFTCPLSYGRSKCEQH